jgi:hypothetical protein
MHTLLRPSLFWDSDLSQIDLEHHAHKIIIRVLERGTLEDWYEIKRIYGKERIKQEALVARSLDKYALAFCSGYFDIPKEQFRCYTTIAFRQNSWQY